FEERRRLGIDVDGTAEVEAISGPAHEECREQRERDRADLQMRAAYDDQHDRADGEVDEERELRQDAEADGEAEEDGAFSRWVFEEKIERVERERERCGDGQVGGHQSRVA